MLLFIETNSILRMRALFCDLPFNLLATISLSFTLSIVPACQHPSLSLSISLFLSVCFSFYLLISSQSEMCQEFNLLPRIEMIMKWKPQMPKSSKQYIRRKRSLLHKLWELLFYHQRKPFASSGPWKHTYVQRAMRMNEPWHQMYNVYIHSYPPPPKLTHKNHSILQHIRLLLATLWSSISIRPSIYPSIYSSIGLSRTMHHRITRKKTPNDSA